MKHSAGRDPQEAYPRSAAGGAKDLSGGVPDVTQGIDGAP